MKIKGNSQQLTLRGLSPRSLILSGHGFLRIRCLFGRSCTALPAMNAGFQRPWASALFSGNCNPKPLEQERKLLNIKGYYSQQLTPLGVTCIHPEGRSLMGRVLHARG